MHSSYLPRKPDDKRHEYNDDKYGDNDNDDDVAVVYCVYVLLCCSNKTQI